MNKHKIKEWLGKHKLEIIGFGVATAAVGTSVVLGIKIRNLKSGRYILKGFPADVEFLTPWLKISDIGKLGEELIKNDPTVNGDTLVEACNLSLLNLVDKGANP